MNAEMVVALIKIGAILAVMYFGWKFLLGGAFNSANRKDVNQTPGVTMLEVAALVSFYAGITRIVQDQMLATVYLGGFCVFLIILPLFLRPVLGMLSFIFAIAFFDLGSTSLFGYFIIVLFVIGRFILGDNPKPWNRT